MLRRSDLRPGAGDRFVRCARRELQTNLTSMNKFGTLLVSLSCFAGIASAQNSPAPVAPPAPAAPAPAPADPAKLALAHEVIKAMQADRSLEAMTGQIKQMVAQQTSMFTPASATEEQKAKVAQMQSQVMDLAMESVKTMMGKMDAVYADVYSVAELEAIKAFFNSSEGKSMLAKQPQLMQRMMPLIQQMQGELMPKIGALVQNVKQELAPAPAPTATATTPPIEVPPATTPAK